ncbi:MAG: sulfatase-like hydrolase/transferase [Candidatus Hydrogenedentes bacterium]|nr:sulfatase-like hydrolase/transferase [Candidatus Hydrogenedentota bacterium]
MSTLNRRDFLRAAAGTSAAGIVGALAGGRALAEERLPNILFIVADDLGWSDLACYGADLHETPNLDRLAHESMRFTNAYAAAPVCSPTRASIMTGKHPARLHMTTWSEAALSPPQDGKVIPPVTRPSLPLGETTLAEALDARYFKAHVGKWHLGEASGYPEAHGFDVNIGGTHWGAPATFFYPFKGMFHEELRYVPDLERGNEDPNAYLTDRLTDEALRLMENVGDRPFYINLCYYTVHTPIEGKPDLVAHFEKKITPEMHHRNAKYAAMVASLDENVGRVLAKLEELGVADNTIVVFFSDNGGFIGENRGMTVTDNAPLRSGKGSLYEGGIRDPLMIRWPGVTTAGSVCETPVMSTDFFPTLLEMTGKETAAMDGLSLVPLLRDATATLDRDTLYWHFPHYYPTTTPVSAVRQGDWKLLLYYEDGHCELYNVREDLGEQHDLAAQKPERVAVLKALLDAWLKEMDAQLPVR